jgi:hypothetical protein
MSWFGGKSKKKKAAEKAAAEAAMKPKHADELKFADEVFTKKEKKQLLLRFTAIANGRDHITKQDFLDQPEVGCNPLLERVVDVVLEDNGHAARRAFEGGMIEATFDDTEKQRDIGIHWDPHIPPTTKKGNGMGAIIEEVVPGGPAALKSNIHSGMRLIAIRTAKDQRGTWNYMMGRTYKETQKFLANPGKYRPMTLLLQDPEAPSISKEYHDSLVKVDESYGGGGFLVRHEVEKKHKKKLDKQKEGYESDSSSSDEDEEKREAEKKEAAKWTIRNYEVEFNDPKLGFGKGKMGYGITLGPIEDKKVGAKVEKVGADSFADNEGQIRVGHFIIGIGKKDATNMTYDKIKQALVTVLKKSSRPIVLKFEVRVKKAVESNSLDADGGHSDDLRPSHCFMQREYLNHKQITSDDFLNILAVSRLVVVGGGGGGGTLIFLFFLKPTGMPRKYGTPY